MGESVKRKTDSKKLVWCVRKTRRKKLSQRHWNSVWPIRLSSLSAKRGCGAAAFAGLVLGWTDFHFNVSVVLERRKKIPRVRIRKEGLRGNDRSRILFFFVPDACCHIWASDRNNHCSSREKKIRKSFVYYVTLAGNSKELLYRQRKHFVLWTLLSHTNSVSIRSGYLFPSLFAIFLFNFTFWLCRCNTEK